MSVDTYVIVWLTGALVGGVVGHRLAWRRVRRIIEGTDRGFRRRRERP